MFPLKWKAWQKMLSHEPPCLFLWTPFTILLAVTGKWASCQHHHWWPRSTDPTDTSTLGSTDSPHPQGYFSHPQKHFALILYIGNTKNLILRIFFFSFCLTSSALLFSHATICIYNIQKSYIFLLYVFGKFLHF